VLIAAQANPFEDLKAGQDTTLALLRLRACAGDDVRLYTAKDLSWRDGALHARTRRLGAEGAPEAAGSIRVADAAVVMIRDNPPFDLRRQTAAHLHARLERFEDGGPLMVNHPHALMTMSSKLATLGVPDAPPASLVTSDPAEAAAFAEGRDGVVVKPLYGFGGEGVTLLDAADDVAAAIAAFRADGEAAGDYREYFIVQEKLAAAAEGDKRVILADGEPIGAVLRVPGEEGGLANLSAGGSAVAADLTDRERRIAEALKPTLARAGAFLTGLDFIGERLTEVNTISPGGLVDAAKVSDEPVAERFWERVERRLAARA